MLLGNRPPGSCDDDRKLAVLWGAGFSANDIAEQFPGRSRNSITGRAFRLRLQRRPSPIPTITKAQRARLGREQNDADEAYAREIGRAAK